MTQSIDAAWTADRVMKEFPQTVPVFLVLKTACVGCYLKRFCTLEEVAAAYNIPLDDVLDKLVEIVPISAERGE